MYETDHAGYGFVRREKGHIVKHLLIFEPQTRGHHLSWLRYIAEDFLSAEVELTLAADMRPESEKSVRHQLSDILSNIHLISVYDNSGKWRGGTKSRSIADCFEQSNADEVLMSNFDELASSWMRRAFFGIYPPEILRGKISGIYFRPRFLENPYLAPGNIIKTIGFKKLCNNGWLKRIFLLDETLLSRADRFQTRFHILPDTWSGNFSTPQLEARKILNIPSDKFVFLHYGVGDKRKGLHLAVRAMLDNDSEFFLLCAGKLGNNREIFNGIRKLEDRNQAKIINHYLSDEESDSCFCASDVVLLPYIRHFGSSGVLSKAAAAAKAVIVSDEGLLAHRVREYGLGLLFSSGNAKSLYESMRKISESDMQQYRACTVSYAELCSRNAFRKSLLSAFL